MEKVILKKENGNVIESNVLNQSIKTPYLANREKCFGIDESSIKTSKETDIHNVLHLIETMLSGVDENIVKQLMEKIKSSTCINDLQNGLNFLINSYIKSMDLKVDDSKKSGKHEKKLIDKNINKIQLYLKNNQQLVISVFIKKTIENYYYNILLKFDKEKINNIHNYKLQNDDMNKLFTQMGEEFDENSRENGVYRLSKRIFSDQIDIVFEKLQKHLCWQNCKYACPSQCEKVADYVKKEIGQYKFITDGYQVIDKSRSVDTFVVTGCLNYEKEEKRELTEEERIRAKRAKESLRIAYFDAETLDEAYIIQNDLEKRGAINNIRGKRLCLERLNQLRKK